MHTQWEKENELTYLREKLHEDSPQMPRSTLKPQTLRVAITPFATDKR